MFQILYFLVAYVVRPDWFCGFFGHSAERCDETSDGEFRYFNLRCRRCHKKL